MARAEENRFSPSKVQPYVKPNRTENRFPAETANRMQVIYFFRFSEEKKGKRISIRLLVTNGSHMCGIWFSKESLFFASISLGYFGTDERLAIKRGDRVQIGQPSCWRNGKSTGPSRLALWNVLFWFPRGSRVRFFEMLASFVTRNLKTFEQAWWNFRKKKYFKQVSTDFNKRHFQTEGCVTVRN